MVRALNTTVHRVNKTHFMPAMAWLSCYGQQTISINIVSKIAKPYLCPGPDNADRSHHQAAGHHRHYSKYMLNPTAYFCSCPIALLFPFGKLAVSAALALQSFTKSPLLKQARSIPQNDTPSPHTHQRLLLLSSSSWSNTRLS